MKWLSRAISATFCVTTAVYAFLASSSFTYQQFLRPRVLEGVARFSDWHAMLYWLWLLLTLASLAPDFTKRSGARNLAGTFAAVWTAIGIGLTIHPVLPALVDDRRSILVGLVALVPPVWLAVIDHVALRGFLLQQSHAVAQVATDEVASTERRLLVAAVGTAVCVAIMYGVLTPLAIREAFEPDLLTVGLTLGLAWSLLDHLLIFCGVFLVLALVERLVRGVGDFRLRYGLEFVVLVLMLWVALQRLVGDAIGLDDVWGSAAMLGLSAAIMSTWAALRLRHWARESACLASGYDVFFGPRQDSHVSAGTVVALVSIVAVAFVLVTVAARLDWDFLLLKLGVLLVWIVTFTQIYRASSGEVRVGGSAIAFVCALPLIGHVIDPALQSRLPQWLGSPESTVRHTLDRYVVYNPTFRLADGALRDPAVETPAFDQFVRANTGLNAASVPPTDIDFVPNLQRSQVVPRPHVFLLVIDSLRSDYLSPYNAHVSFTPRVAEFAADSFVFQNAFTRYGGTGLSMSAIWMGAAGPHRQYVQPFRPMNALEKLLDANGYRRYVSLDHIMEQLLTSSPSLIALDRGIPELEYDFCGTLGEIEDKLKVSDDSEPVFAHTRSLNLHVAALNRGTVPRGESYPGFEERYAARVRRLDGCFGAFIDFLKRRGLYDQSVIILTGDHGEMLGEDRQWGHAYYLFPPVLEIPLIVHVPPALARHVVADVDAISFSTDITPTLYALLGYQPERHTSLMGQPLLAAPGTDFLNRRRATEVVAASYGAVWGALYEKGRRLYIVDANHGKEYSYDHQPRGNWQAVAVNSALRTVSQRAIREYIDEITRVYRVSVR